MKTYTEVVSLAAGISILGIPANGSWTWYVQRGLHPKATKTPAASYAEALILAKKAVYNCQHPNLTTVKEVK